MRLFFKESCSNYSSRNKREELSLSRKDFRKLQTFEKKFNGAEKIKTVKFYKQMHLARMRSIPCVKNFKQNKSHHA